MIFHLKYDLEHYIFFLHLFLLLFVLLQIIAIYYGKKEK